MYEKVLPGDFFGVERFAIPWGQVMARRMMAMGLWIYCECTASVGVK
jgi:hypothetical protein